VSISDINLSHVAASFPSRWDDKLRPGKGEPNPSICVLVVDSPYKITLTDGRKMVERVDSHTRYPKQES